MTALKLTNGFKANFRLRVKSNKKFAITCLIMNLLSAPLFLIAFMVYCSQEIKYNKLLLEKAADTPSLSEPFLNLLYIFIPAFATAIAIIIGIFIAFNTFSYLYKKSNVDMYMPLPLTTRQRFFSDFLAGVTCYIGPFLVSGVISMILSFIVQPLYQNKYIDKYGYSQFFNNIPYTMFKLILFGSIIMLSLYILTILVITLCGNIFEGVLYTVLVNAVIPLSILMGGKLLFGNLYGIDSTDSISALLYRSSPAGSGICLFSYFKDGTHGSDSIIYTFWMIPYLILTAVLFGLAYLLFKKRKAEQVGKPIVFKAFYHAILTVIIFTISSVFVIKAGYDDFKHIVIPMIITTAIFYLIFEVAINRGFKKIWQGGIRYAVTIASIIAIVIIANKTEGFGSVYKLPDTHDVASVSTDYTGAYGQGLNDIYNSSYMTFKDKKVIQDFIDFHSDVLEEHKKNGTDDSIRNYCSENEEIQDHFDVTIIYNLKNGSKITRYYFVDKELYKKLFSVDLSDEYMNKIAGSYTKFSNNFGKELNVFLYKVNGNDVTRTRKTHYFKDKEELKGFIEAYIKDLKSISLEDYSAFKVDVMRISIEEMFYASID